MYQIEAAAELRQQRSVSIAGRASFKTVPTANVMHLDLLAASPNKLSQDKNVPGVFSRLYAEPRHRHGYGDKFVGVRQELAARMRRRHVTFTASGLVDEETQKKDLDIVREVLKVTKEVYIERAYDFSFAKKEVVS